MTQRRLGFARPAPNRPQGPVADTTADPLGSPRVRALAMDIAYRLRSVCGHLPEGELVRLVTQLAVAQQNGDPPRAGS